MRKPTKRITRRVVRSAHRLNPGIGIVNIYAKYTDRAGSTRRELGTVALDVNAFEQFIDLLRA